MLEAHGRLNTGHPINYGLGLWLGEYRGLKTVEHSGGTFGYRTELLRFPEQKFSAVILCNIASADVEGFARKISDLYLEKELRSEADATARSQVYPDPAPFAQRCCLPKFRASTPGAHPHYESADESVWKGRWW
jgi:hypothetical protein